MEIAALSVLQILMIVICLLLQQVTGGNPRSEIVEVKCSTRLKHNSTLYDSNFILAMENVSQQIRTNGYGVAVSGSGLDAVYALAQCYGDLSLQDCVWCNSVLRSLFPQCLLQTGERVFLDGCFARIENYSFFQEYIAPEDKAICGNSTRKDLTFQQAARSAVLKAVSEARNNNGYGPVESPTKEAVYVLADCWKSLNPDSCRACLENASGSVLGCLPWSEGRAVYTGCFMRYSDTNFLNPLPNSGHSRGTTTVVIVATISSIVLVAGGAIIAAYIWKHNKMKKKRKGYIDEKKLAKILNDSSLNFKFSTLEKATGSFHEANKLGEGGFGSVYKGVLPDGREIAVKRLFFNNRLRASDFYNEVNIISTLEHKNLVRLLGCSSSESESILVYEFLPNKSLDHFIFDSDRGKELNWEKRFGIITGTAEGLVYLHNNTKIRIIHRDIKASNILLDARFRAKVADFGLARSFQDDKSYISTAIAGTLGYMAPEYLAHGKLTEKADVYSFGVLLLEIVTGMQNNDMKTSEHSNIRVLSLVNLVWKHFQQQKMEELFDPNLMFNNFHNISIKTEALRVVHIGLLCTQANPLLRPSMSKALQMLVERQEHLPPPTDPPFIDEKTMELNDTIQNETYPIYSHNPSIASVSHSIFLPR